MNVAVRHARMLSTMVNSHVPRVFAFMCDGFLCGLILFLHHRLHSRRAQPCRLTRRTKLWKRVHACLDLMLTEWYTESTFIHPSYKKYDYAPFMTDDYLTCFPIGLDLAQFCVYAPQLRGDLYYDLFLFIHLQCQPVYAHVFVCMCMHIYIHVCVCTYVCVVDILSMRTCSICLYTYIHTYIHTYIQIIHTYTQMIHARIHTYIHKCRIIHTHPDHTYIHSDHTYRSCIHAIIHTYMHA